jgi:predicted secreted acid phosphatase
MSNLRYIHLLLFAILGGCASPYAFAPNAPPNLGDLKTELIAYHDQGRWAADQARVAADAEAWLTARAAGGGRLAAVFDIDETSLNNWQALRANDFGFILPGPCALPRGPCGMIAWIDMSRGTAIAPSLALYRRARALGVDVFFITGRKDSLRPATERNLRDAGYTGWTALIMEPNDRHFRSAADFKAPHRAAIEAKGYRIVLNIGDQPSDLAGGYAERAFLLPNPYYRIP